MSSRSIAEVLRDAARTARNIKQKTVPQDIAEFCFKAAERYGMMTSEWMRQAAIEKIIRIITKRSISKKVEMESENQFRFFEDYEDIVFDIQHKKGTVQKELGSFGLDDIDQVTKQKDNNINAAMEEREEWHTSCALIIPLLRKHPKWVWRDAVEHLRANGGLN